MFKMFKMFLFRKTKPASSLPTIQTMEIVTFRVPAWFQALQITSFQDLNSASLKKVELLDFLF